MEAAGYDRFALMAMAQGGPTAIAYAEQHQHAVSRMVFYNTFADAYLEKTPEAEALQLAFERLGWVGTGRSPSSGGSSAR